MTTYHVAGDIHEGFVVLNQNHQVVVGRFATDDEAKTWIAEPKFIVTVIYNGNEWPLRGTVWALHMDRAQIFASPEAAQAGLEKAKKFMKANLFKAATIKGVI